MNEFQKDHKLNRIALLVAFACVLQIAESLIPHPIPGLRLGLANILTLTAMVTLGFGYALEVAILRTILSAFIMGTFMSPTFILKFFGRRCQHIDHGILLLVIRRSPTFSSEYYRDQYHRCVFAQSGPTLYGLPAPRQT